MMLDESLGNTSCWAADGVWANRGDDVVRPRLEKIQLFDVCLYGTINNSTAPSVDANCERGEAHGNCFV